MTKYNTKYTIVNGMKLCGSCNLSLPIDRFTTNKVSASGLEYFCKDCALVRRGKYQKPGAHFKSKYGITIEEYDDLVLSQDGKCKICHCLATSFKGDRLVVDHDHNTGVVRGLLCSHCNTMLGMARDKAEVLRSAIAYLEA